MATSPTVLAGASSAAPPDSSPASVAAPVEAKFPLIPLLIAVVVGVLVATLGVGGVVYYLVRTGRLSGREGSAHRTEIVIPAATHSMVLEPLLVNLADAGGSSYLRVAMTLRVADATEGKEAKPKEEKPKEDKENSGDVAAVRDTMLTVLGRQTADRLLASDGKEQLKAELKAALAEHNAGLKVMDVFFTDFLVQR
ncbi:flagellar basal body-associated FliL family protein [Tunturibacter empetritectus]|uniref:Flagellar protein FliL n=1 Tax=Tunturiibacter empetritectus TaxID=3069691 RepID=A0A7W8IGD7_9BACT|nr:flagellar basal body-associated FliL family protein [Edaphobacter lichenicola]MBB5315728.1 flagellar FliL protein [Edaphobacter lichenicola]